MQTDADVRSQPVGNRAKLGFAGPAVIGRRNQPERSRSVSRTSPEARSNRQILFEAKAPERETGLGFRRKLSGFQDEIVAWVEGAREGPGCFER